MERNIFSILKSTLFSGVQGTFCLFLQLIQDLKKENFDLKLRLFMEQKEREVSEPGTRHKLHTN